MYKSKVISIILGVAETQNDSFLCVFDEET